LSLHAEHQVPRREVQIAKCRMCRHSTRRRGLENWRDSCEPKVGFEREVFEGSRFAACRCRGIESGRRSVPKQKLSSRSKPSLGRRAKSNSRRGSQASAMAATTQDPSAMLASSNQVATRSHWRRCHVCGHLEERIEIKDASPRTSSCGNCGKTFAPFFYIVDEISEVSADLLTLDQAEESVSGKAVSGEIGTKHYRPLIGFTLCWEPDLVDLAGTETGHFKTRKSRSASRMAPRGKAAR